MSMVIDIVFFDGTDWATMGHCGPSRAVLAWREEDCGLSGQRAVENRREIVVAAGLAKSGFNNHFTSKDAPLAAVTEKAMDEGGDALASRRLVYSVVHDAVTQRHAGRACAAAFRGT